MSPSPEAPAPGVPDLPPAPTPRERLWRRYRKARGARAGLFMVMVFSLAAFFAPFLAHRLPLFWHDAATGETTFPLIREFFSPSDTTEPMLEKGINFLFLFIPAALAAWRLMNRHRPGLARTESRALSLLFGGLFSTLLWIAIGGMVIQAGGRDWLHAESAPVPEIDDIDDPLAAAPSAGTFSADPVLDAVWSRLAGIDADAYAEYVNQADALSGTGPLSVDAADALRRPLAAILQKAIDGPAILSPAGAGPGVDTAGITDGNLSIGINTARWNRIAVEAAFPGLLRPMRQTRTAFIAMAAVSALVLAGLTYIFMAGANQFALSPRWLVLLALGAALSLLFQGTPRHDHTPYRRLAAEGGGTGLFPLIPYGPNEQGFGPRLPPSWAVEPPFIGEGGVRSWERLGNALAEGRTPEAKTAAELLTSALPEWPDMLASDDGRAAVAAALNRLIADGRLYDPDAPGNTRGDFAVNPYLNALQAAGELAKPDRERLNRLLLERALPGALVPVTPIRWKKPQHTPGVHVFGTDESGRDVLVRVIHGARVSLSVGFVSVFLATVIGLVLGSMAAYYGNRVDMAISRFIEVMMCFPSFFLILAIIAVLDRRSIVNIMLVIGLTGWTGVARLVRGEMLRQKKMEYVAASVALGAPDTRTIFRHILPNAMAPVLVSISFGITGAIMTEASLSFMGFGVTPPTPTWGQLLSETRDSPLANWWLAVFPGFILFCSVIAYNMVGEALRDALDPRTSL